jgi:uncharacterized protein YkwD
MRKTGLFILLVSFVQILSAQNTTDYYTNFDWESIQKNPLVTQRIDLAKPNYALINALVFHATNAERKKKKLALFIHDQTLEDVAAAHSVDMHKRDFFDHTNPSKKTFSDRIEKGDADFTTNGENIALQFIVDAKTGERLSYQTDKNGNYTFYRKNKKIEVCTYLEFALKVVQMWMDSPPHKKNILEKSFTHLGCGTFVKPNAFRSTNIPKALITQDFGARG